MGDDAQLIGTLQKGLQEVTAALAKADQAIARVDDLRAEIARLRAGESERPAAEGVQLTPAEWVHRWNRAAGEERLEVAAHIMNAAVAARRCETADHGAELDHLRQGVARVRALHPNRDEAHAQQNALCIECASPAPCRTRRALDGEVTDGA